MNWKNLLGAFQDLFGIGGPAGINLKHNSGKLEARNAADTAFVPVRGQEVQAANTLNDLTTLLDLEGNVAGIEFDFNGASAPAPNANPSKFGFCHTSGGGYTAGDVVYDNGTALLKLPSEVAKRVTTTTAVAGTINLIANGFYVREGGSWTLKGDGSGATTGMIRAIKLAYAYTDTTVDSTTDVPDGSVVVGVINNVKTAFDGAAPTVAVAINGSTPLTVMATTESEAKNVAEYEVEEIAAVAAINAGKARVTVTPDASTAGAGEVFVMFVTPLS